MYLSGISIQLSYVQYNFMSLFTEKEEKNIVEAKRQLPIPVDDFLKHLKKKKKKNWFDIEHKVIFFFLNVEVFF